MSSQYRDQFGAKSIGLRAALYQGQVLVLGGKRQHYSAVGDEVGRDIFRFPECELLTKTQKNTPCVLQVFAYDAEAGVWTSRAALRTKRCWHAVTAVNLTDLCLGQGKTILKKTEEPFLSTDIRRANPICQYHIDSSLRNVDMPL